MIKIEHVSKGGRVEVNGTEVYEGQLLTHLEYACINVISGKIMVSIDENELVTLAAKETSTTVENNVVRQENIDSAKPTNELAQGIHSAKSPKISK